MTDTAHAEISSSGDHVTGTLEHLNPHSLTLELNVRDCADLDDAFVASIKEHGVLVPIAAVRAADGTITVRAGQRRTLAAREAHLQTVPVYVRPITASDDAAQLVDRVSEQIVENDQRKHLTDAQRARGIQQMIDAGVSVTKVAKKLAIGKDAIKAAAAAARSATAMDALSSGQLSLTEAAALTEFEDMPGAVDRLMRSSGSGWFDHTVAQLRQEREAAQESATAAQPYTEKGFTVLEARPNWWDPAYIPLRNLVTPEGCEADDTAITDPAQWAVCLVRDIALCDVQTGEIVDEDNVDWDTENAPGTEPAEGLRHANSVTETTIFEPNYYCLDHRGAGLIPEERFARRAGMADCDPSGDVDLDDDAREAARQQAAADRAEAERRERRKVLALNRLGDAAVQVRREFLSKLLARKTPPKGAASFIAECLSRDSYLLSSHGAGDTSASLLGVENPQAISKLLASLPGNGDGRALVITLALVLGALESRTPKDAWRNPSPGGWAPHVGSAEYLRWLAEHDYVLAPVEEIVTTAKSADEVYDQYMAEAAS